MPPDLPLRTFRGVGGAQLVYRELGEGRPIVLLHGYFSTATVNWIRYGHADEIAARGHRVIMPDLRAHGDSARSHAEASYPPDVLADDAFALLDQLGLVDYDLGGYSLGARTVVRLLVRGATPRRAIIAGTGLAGLTHTADSRAQFRHVLTNLGSHEHGSEAWRAEAFLKTTHGDPDALIKILDTFVDTPPELIAQIQVPTLVVVGEDDNAQQSADQIAALLPNGTFVTVPGNHMSAASKPELGAVIADFLDEP